MYLSIYTDFCKSSSFSSVDFNENDIPDIQINQPLLVYSALLNQFPKDESKIFNMAISVKDNLLSETIKVCSSLFDKHYLISKSILPATIELKSITKNADLLKDDWGRLLVHFNVTMSKQLQLFSEKLKKSIKQNGFILDTESRGLSLSNSETSLNDFGMKYVPMKKLWIFKNSLNVGIEECLYNVIRNEHDALHPGGTPIGPRVRRNQESSRTETEEVEREKPYPTLRLNQNDNKMYTKPEDFDIWSEHLAALRCKSFRPDMTNEQVSNAIQINNSLEDLNHLYMCSMKQAVEQLREDGKSEDDVAKFIAYTLYPAKRFYEEQTGNIPTKEQVASDGIAFTQEFLAFITGSFTNNGIYPKEILKLAVQKNTTRLKEMMIDACEQYLDPETQEIIYADIKTAKPNIIHNLRSPPLNSTNNVEDIVDNFNMLIDKEIALAQFAYDIELGKKMANVIDDHDLINDINYHRELKLVLPDVIRSIYSHFMETVRKNPKYAEFWLWDETNLKFGGKHGKRGKRGKDEKDEKLKHSPISLTENLIAILSKLLTVFKIMGVCLLLFGIVIPGTLGHETPNEVVTYDHLGHVDIINNITSTGTDTREINYAKAVFEDLDYLKTTEFENLRSFVDDEDAVIDLNDTTIKLVPFQIDLPDELIKWGNTPGNEGKDVYDWKTYIELEGKSSTQRVDVAKRNVDTLIKGIEYEVKQIPKRIRPIFASLKTAESSLDATREHKGDIQTIRDFGDLIDATRNRNNPLSVEAWEILSSDYSSTLDSWLTHITEHDTPMSLLFLDTLGHFLPAGSEAFTRSLGEYRNTFPALPDNFVARNSVQLTGQAVNYLIYTNDTMSADISNQLRSLIVVARTGLANPGTRTNTTEPTMNRRVDNFVNEGLRSRERLLTSFDDYVEDYMERTGVTVTAEEAKTVKKMVWTLLTKILYETEYTFAQRLTGETLDKVDAFISGLKSRGLTATENLKKSLDDIKASIQGMRAYVANGTSSIFEGLSKMFNALGKANTELHDAENNATYIKTIDQTWKRYSQSNYTYNPKLETAEFSSKVFGQSLEANDQTGWFSRLAMGSIVKHVGGWIDNIVLWSLAGLFTGIGAFFTLASNMEALWSVFRDSNPITFGTLKVILLMNVLPFSVSLNRGLVKPEEDLITPVMRADIKRVAPHIDSKFFRVLDNAATAFWEDARVVKAAGGLSAIIPMMARTMNEIYYLIAVSQLIKLPLYLFGGPIDPSGQNTSGWWTWLVDRPSSLIILLSSFIPQLHTFETLCNDYSPIIDFVCIVAGTKVALLCLQKAMSKLSDFFASEVVVREGGSSKLVYIKNAMKSVTAVKVARAIPTAIVFAFYPVSMVNTRKLADWVFKKCFRLERILEDRATLIDSIHNVMFSEGTLNSYKEADRTFRDFLVMCILLENDDFYTKVKHDILPIYDDLNPVDKSNPAIDLNNDSIDLNDDALARKHAYNFSMD